MCLQSQSGTAMPGMGDVVHRDGRICSVLLADATRRAEDLEAEVFGDNGQKLGVGRPIGALFEVKEGFEMPIAMAPAIVDDGADAPFKGGWVLNSNDQGRGEIIESFVLWR